MSISSDQRVVASGDDVVGADEVIERGFRGSLARSLVTPIWTFNIYPLAYMSIGMILATIGSSTWDWQLWALAAACIWFGDEGVHNYDLAPDDIAIQLDSRIQLIVGTVYLLIGLSLGVLLASLTSWWFLVLVGTGAFFSVAYNLEWFDGLLHDRDYVVGTGNLSFNVAGIPAFGGFFLFAHSWATPLDLVGMGLVAVGLMCNLSGLDLLEQDAKEARYQIFATPSTRDVDANVERLQMRAMNAHLWNMACFWLLAIGLSITFLL